MICLIHIAKQLSCAVFIHLIQNFYFFFRISFFVFTVLFISDLYYFTENHFTDTYFTDKLFTDKFILLTVHFTEAHFTDKFFSIKHTNFNSNFILTLP